MKHCNSDSSKPFPNGKVSFCVPIHHGKNIPLPTSDLGLAERGGSRKGSCRHSGHLLLYSAERVRCWLRDTLPLQTDRVWTQESPLSPKHATQRQEIENQVTEG